MQDTPITISKILLKTSKISTLEIGSSAKLPVNPLAHCTLKWRYKRLWVGYTQQPQEPYLPSLDNQEWLVDCLKHSPVQVVCIEPNVGEGRLRLWADACEQAHKSIFLRIPCKPELPSKKQPIRWWLKRVIEWNIAALLLLVLSPVILVAMLLMGVFSTEPIFSRQWRVGERGKLFQLLELHTMKAHAQTQDYQLIGNQNRHHKSEQKADITTSGGWLSKYVLDKLPQLVNVLRGEMSLVGPRPWSLDEAALLSKSEQQQLRMLPGVIGGKS